MMTTVTASIPEATERGITLRGLRELRLKLEQLVETGYFKKNSGESETDFNKITTNDIVEKCVLIDSRAPCVLKRRHKRRP